MKTEKEPGEKNKYEIIPRILREYASCEKPIGVTEIIRHAKEMGCKLSRTSIENFMAEKMVRSYETEEDCDEYLREWHADEREIYFCKTSKEGRRTRGYWMLETISDSEWMYLMDSVLYSKVLTKKEADNLAKRITVLAGRAFSDLTKYRYRMKDQPYFYGNKDIDEKIGHIESRVLKQVHLIRDAINKRKKVKFTLNVYKYGNQEVRLVHYENSESICSPFEIVYSNGRYYMLGADLETERSENLKYKLYRIDLMTDVSITRALATTKKDAGIQELSNLFQYRIENPYMFTGDVQRIRIRVDAEQFTQIVDWFGDNFSVEGYDANEDTYYDIDVSVNISSFKYFLLQYSGCVQVLNTGKEREESFRSQMRDTLKKALDKYEEVN